MTSGAPSLLSFHRNVSHGLIGLGALFVSFTAHAANDSESKAAARELAVEGIQLAQAGQCDAALPKLVKAEQLYHAPTILLWQADCEIQLGRIVEGTEHLNQLTREQLAKDAPTAFRDAQKKAGVLLEKNAPRIARLTIEVSPSTAAEITVTLNGKVVPAAMLGAPRPTDPGPIEVQASASGFKTSLKSISLPEAARETLTITLEVDPTVPAGAPLNSQNQPKDGGEEKSSVLPTLGWIGIGTGAAALAAGGIFGLMAIGSKGDLNCPNSTCTSTGDIDKLNSANAQATLSTVFFVAGGVLAGAGLTLLIVSDEGAPTGATVSAALLPGGAAVRGTF